MTIHTMYGDCRPAVEFALNLLDHGCRCMEVGVQNGDHARIMCDVLRPSRMVCVDPWVDLDWSWKSEVYSADSFGMAQSKLQAYPYVEFVRERSQIALPEMPADSLDFVYLDGDHSRAVCESDIRNSLRLVRLGGVVGGHDWGLPTHVVRWGASASVSVAGGIEDVFDGHEVCGKDGDWWMVVTPELKKLAAK